MVEKHAITRYIADITDISQLPEHYLKEIEHFFSQYKALENKTVEVKGWEDNQAAKEAVFHSPSSIQLGPE